MSTVAPPTTFTPDDAQSLSRLPLAVGWNDTLDDWRTFLACAVVMGHRAPDGSAASCGIRFDYGGVTSIGKMVVHPSFQRRGLGLAVMRALLALGDATHTTLAATDQGRPLYESLGFVTVGHVHKLVAERAPLLPRDPAFPLRAVDADSLDAVFALDREAFGADRSAMLRARARQAERRVVLADGSGYGFRIGGPLPVVGPIVAPDAARARALIAALVDEGPCRVDLADGHEALADWLTPHGFVSATPRPVLSLGGTAPPGDRARYVALASQALA